MNFPYRTREHIHGDAIRRITIQPDLMHENLLMGSAVVRDGESNITCTTVKVLDLGKQISQCSYDELVSAVADLWVEIRFANNERLKLVDGIFRIFVYDGPDSMPEIRVYNEL